MNNSLMHKLLSAVTLVFTLFAATLATIGCGDPFAYFTPKSTKFDGGAGGAGGGNGEGGSGGNAQSTTGSSVGGGGGSGGSSTTTGSGAGGEGSTGGAKECTHSTCSAGIVLNPACDSCVAAICTKYPSLECCTTGWSLSCAGAMESTCGIKCGDTPECAHSVCEVGGPLKGGWTTGCSLCVGRVCQMRASCCTDAWDVTCVETVAQAGCSTTCAL